MCVFSADELRTRIGDFHFGAQHVEPGHHARFETTDGVLHFLHQQLDRGLLHDDLLLRQEHVVVRPAHVEQSICDDRLVFKHGLVANQSGGAQGRTDTPAFIDGLHDPNVTSPFIPQRNECL